MFTEKGGYQDVGRTEDNKYYSAKREGSKGIPRNLLSGVRRPPKFAVSLERLDQFNFYSFIPITFSDNYISLITGGIFSDLDAASFRNRTF